MSTDKCNIDVSRYVALGDSITSGYMDGALYFKAQQNAYPAIISSIFGQNPGDFNQPFMRVDSPGINSDGESRLVLKQNENLKDYVLSRFSNRGDVDAFSENNYLNNGPYHNMGVPGAKVITAVMPGFGNSATGFGNYNPFFTRMASNPRKSSMLSDVLLIDPTFFSLFIGNNDALAFALSGGTLNAISPVDSFEKSFRNIVTALTRNHAKGIIANLPSITNIPYFNTIPANGLMLSAEEATQLTSENLTGGLHFKEGANHFLIHDTAQGIRFAEKDELILLDLILDKKKEIYLKGKKPIPKKYTLSRSQISEIETAITAYNVIIQEVTKEKRLAFVDVNSLLKTARPDRVYNADTHNLDYSRKCIFSLDGLHPSPFGQALIANAFIKEINRTYDCNFNFVKSHHFAGINI